MELLALLTGHGGELDLHLADPGHGPDAPDDPVDEHLGVGPALDGHGDDDRHLAPSAVDGPDHPELAQAATPGGVLHRRGGGAHIGIGRGSRRLSRKESGGATRDYAALNR